jgi:adenine-specific DNA-methyltransferase
MTTNKQLFGQYFTTNNELKEIVYKFILNKPNEILEPSIGQGDLVKLILDKHTNITIDMYEIDPTIKLLSNIDKNQVKYTDFLVQNINKKYLTIVGNPPYVRSKKGNLYIDFIDKCVDLLVDNGELIFIIPSDLFKLTSASKLLNKMILLGSFTHIYHPNNDKLFKDATIDIIVFRYCKDSLLPKICNYNNENMYINNSDGLITFTKNINNSTKTFSDLFDIYVGLVSGKDEVYKNELLGNISVLTGENKIEKFIYTEKYPTNNLEINNYLLQNKSDLLNRQIRKFNDNNWFEWGAPRNIHTISDNLGKECIYIYNLTRKDKIAFKSTVQYFGGSLLILIPKQNIDLSKVIEYLNSNNFKNNFIFSGRFKIGHRQLSNSYIPDDKIIIIQ